MSSAPEAPENDDEFMSFVTRNSADFIPSQAEAAVRVAGETVIADCHGVLYWPDEETLIVSDLHLEKGSSFARRGRMLPPYDSDATLRRLAARIAHWRPKRVISLGDSFHDAQGAERLLPAHLALLTQMMRGTDWVWISGNHDPEPPKGIGGTSCAELTVTNLTFRHEPVIGAGPGEIAGHLHPSARIVRRGRSVRRFCFIGDENRMILPPFGAYTGGLNVLDRAYAGLFSGRNFETLMMGPDRLYRIAGAGLSR